LSFPDNFVSEETCFTAVMLFTSLHAIAPIIHRFGVILAWHAVSPEKEFVAIRIV
jgi:hypothetical protein